MMDFGAGVEFLAKGKIDLHRSLPVYQFTSLPVTSTNISYASFSSQKQTNSTLYIFPRLSTLFRIFIVPHTQLYQIERNMSSQTPTTNNKKYVSSKRTTVKNFETGGARSKVSTPSCFPLSPSTDSQSLMELCSFDYVSSTSMETPVIEDAQTRKLRFLSVPPPIWNEDEESPTSVLDTYMLSTPLQQHMNKLLDSSSGDMGKLILVPDNARPLPPLYQSTPTQNNNNNSSYRPVFSKSVSDHSVMNRQSKYRPCRWTSASPQLQQPKYIQPFRPSSPPPPPLLMSPGSLSPSSTMERPENGVSTNTSQHRQAATQSPSYASSPSTDTKPVLPKRSDLDESQHCELPVIHAMRLPNHEQLRRRTSDSLLARPERRDSDHSDYDLSPDLLDKLQSSLETSIGRIE
jgi:hypothetical protein